VIAAIIAGNRRENRLIRLKEFWNRITERKVWNYTPDGDVLSRHANLASAWMSTLFGVPGFFSPRQVNAWLATRPVQRITTLRVEPLKETLFRAG
jgi:NTE family protein